MNRKEHLFIDINQQKKNDIVSHHMTSFFLNTAFHKMAVAHV